MIHIIVCMKIVIDPEVPFSGFRIDREAMKPIPPEGMPPVINLFDENALEAALRIKDEQECKITVLSLGRTLPKAILQKALALGADDAIGLEGPEFENLDPFSTADALASAVRRIEKYDLIFAGRQAADWDSGIVWAGIAEALHLPAISIARKATISGDKVITERVASDGIEVLEADIPAVINFSNEVGVLRQLNLPDLVKARKREITKWSAGDIDFKNINPMRMADLYIPDLPLVECRFVQGETGEEKGRALARELAQAGYFRTEV
jgi:electron transfer flavoprotein beta subunit